MMFMNINVYIALPKNLKVKHTLVFTSIYMCVHCLMLIERACIIVKCYVVHYGINMHCTLDYLDSSVILYNTSNWEVGTLCMLNVWCGTLIYLPSCSNV